ncbi:hypothetical protein KM176_07275 [Pseudooceanicola sp. CBS1P-1]|uniref:Antifreeze protein n=1 Tax=Pseudooceanicola albus TaxID=2692189 RepID=A0A6L7G1V1_9RHOB|nr:MULTISPECIES: hypothetical protein [Pseudooceanicola]MBT9383653.1 hypothetical protein [Pseudooceanicola endophyticus]MXN17508.1 hypothetical protein [Pseudooceanicola albus]
MIGLGLAAAQGASAQAPQAVGRDQGAGNPITAIDWLSALSAAGIVVPDSGLQHNEPPVSQSALTPPVSSAPLGGVEADAVGLLPTSVTGLPASLWQGSTARDIAQRLARLDVTSSPAMQSLLYTLLLAEVDPPGETPSEGGDPLLRARIDKLRDLGAVEPALALIERAGPKTDPALFQRWFELSLLNGTEATPCQSIATDPGLAPDQGSRIFCLARDNDWDTAALLLDSATALGNLPPAEAHLLSRFLDVDSDDTAVALPPPARISPLMFRLSEAIGEPMATAGLPRAYAVSDLRGISGWKAELDAAERLARTGALPENALLGIYTSGQPSASGGIWDRVAALQAFDTALGKAPGGGTDAKVLNTLPGAWDAMGDAQLRVPFARIYGAQLAAYSHDAGPAGRIATRAALLAPGFEQAAAGLTAHDDTDRFLLALAQGKPDTVAPPSEAARLITEGFAEDTRPPEALMDQIRQGRLGEAILGAMELYLSARAGDLPSVVPALATFRAVGLEDTARQAALQLILLDDHV